MLLQYKVYIFTLVLAHWQMADDRLPVIYSDYRVMRFDDTVNSDSGYEIDSWPLIWDTKWLYQAILNK